jgi:anti-anti-sigma factor
MLVTREVLRQQLWREDTFVDFDNGLNTAVSKLREALGDTAEKHRYVETLGRRGYRFVGSVEEVGARPATRLRDLEVQTDRIEPDVVLVHIAGKIVHGPECHQIEWLIASLLSEGEKKIILDISCVCRLDSAGVGILVMCHGKVKEAAGELRVAGAGGQIKSVLEMTRIEEIVPLYPTIAEALEGFVGTG